MHAAAAEKANVAIPRLGAASEGWKMAGKRVARAMKRDAVDTA